MQNVRMNTNYGLLEPAADPFYLFSLRIQNFQCFAFHAMDQILLPPLIPDESSALLVEDLFAALLVSVLESNFNLMSTVPDAKLFFY